MKSPLSHLVPALARAGAAAAVAIVAAGSLQAQTTRRPLDHDAYDVWNRIRGETLSPDGRWLAYELVPGDGDGRLLVRELDSGDELTLERGTDPTFTDDSRFLVLTVEPSEDSVKAARKAREDDKSVELPKDRLAIVDFRLWPAIGSDVTTWVERVKSFRVPEEGPARVAYLLEPIDDEAEEEAEEAAEEEEPAAAAEETPDSADSAEKPEKEDGSTLVLRDLAGGTEHRYQNVTEYAFSEDGTLLFFLTQSEDGTADGAFRVRTSDGTAEPVLTGEGVYTDIAASPHGRSAAFLSNRDDWASDQPAHALWVVGENGDASALASATSPGLPEGWWISDEATPRFSDDGERVFFGTRERPEPEGDDDEEEDEDDPTVELDVWNWKDGYLQPMQLVRAERERTRTYLAAVPSDGGSVVQLETVDLPDVELGADGDADVALASTDAPYQQLISWDGRYSDVYVVDVETGERSLVVEAAHGFGGGNLSPEAEYVYWWDGAEKAWFARDVDGGAAVNMTAGLPWPVHDELDDHPDEPPPYGPVTWTEGDDWAVVHDKHDIWAVDPEGRREARNLTGGMGRDENLRFRYQRVDPDEDAVPLDREVLLTSFDLATKTEAFYRDRLGDDRPPRLLLEGDYRYGSPTPAEDADVLVWTRESFTEFPDLWVSGPDLADARKVSEANPQQSEYRWGTVELVEWTSNDGEPLQGLLYKPDGFDASQEYPMMVYFYERSSDGLNRYHVPAAGGSSINFSFYVSRGYLLFVPDIPYEIGFPGESALDAVVPGVLALIDEGFVDPDRIGVQGHSWGGYQIAHMITRTNLFAAAEAGAPVSNMTSAYGGIRWGSGMSRMFQYERTQSRIGGTLWDAQHRYIENSPLFFADKVQTPVLMMHNDEDGAVPWYQGIEYFVALRRLGKPVWLLNYNGEDHGLRQEHNRKDWAIRMQQFFDHYLKDAPPPVWLAEGIPATEKGDNLGLDLVTETPSQKPITQGSGSGGG